MSEETSSKQAPATFMEKFVPVLSLITIALVFIVGVLWQKINRLEKGAKVAGTQQAKETTTTVTLDKVKELFEKDLIKFGDADSKVLLVEISDPSCPYCSIAAGKNPTLNKQAGDQFKLVADGGTYIAPVLEFKKLIDEGKASYVYIYFPGHGNGEMGAKALYCAYEQGKYWEAHDLLMGAAGYALLNDTVKNDKAQSQTLANFLKSSVDSTKLKECLDSGKYDARITSDSNLASSFGVTGTPSFFINTSKFPGAYGYDQMKPVVEEALK
jgi:protein-disulfide isomerase